MQAYTRATFNIFIQQRIGFVSVSRSLVLALSLSSLLCLALVFCSSRLELSIWTAVAAATSHSILAKTHQSENNSTTFWMNGCRCRFHRMHATIKHQQQQCKVLPSIRYSACDRSSNRGCATIAQHKVNWNVWQQTNAEKCMFHTDTELLHTPYVYPCTRKLFPSSLLLFFSILGVSIFDELVGFFRPFFLLAAKRFWQKTTALKKINFHSILLYYREILIYRKWKIYNLG